MPHTPADTDVYEVFAQSGQGKALNHVGSIVAPRREAAWHLAKETYGRRDDLTRLCVVRRTDMIVSGTDDGVLLAAKTRMPHRQPGFPTARRRDRSPAADTAATPSERRDIALSLSRDYARGTGEARFAELCLALADDLFVLGNWLGAHIVDYIDLEESLAIGSIGQEALAHAETLLVLCGFDQPAADAWFFDRAREHWQVSRVIGRLVDWPSTVACGLVIAAAVTALAEQALGVEPAISAIRDEQQVHLDHWRRWARALADWPETRTEFARAYAEVTECAGDLFGALPQRVSTDAVSGCSASAAALHERLAVLVGDSGGPGSCLPDRPLARTVGMGGKVLAYCLSRGRAVRDHYAPEVFQ